MASRTARKNSNPSRADQRLRALKSATSHPLRFEALKHFEAHPRSSPKEISDALGVALGNISYHVGALRDDGLIKLKETEPRRGAVEHYYELTDLGREALQVVRAWIS